MACVCVSVCEEVCECEAWSVWHGWERVSVCLNTPSTLYLHGPLSQLPAYPPFSAPIG